MYPVCRTFHYRTSTINGSKYKEMPGKKRGRESSADVGTSVDQRRNIAVSVAVAKHHCKSSQEAPRVLLEVEPFCQLLPKVEISTPVDDQRPQSISGWRGTFRNVEISLPSGEGEVFANVLVTVLQL